MPTSTYPLDKLLNLWRRGDLTAEQMVGHLLQHHIELEKRIHHLEALRPTTLPGSTADAVRQ